MPSFQLSYFVGTRLLATTEIEAPFPPFSLAYFCHTCGDIWGRVLVSGQSDTPHWGVEHCPCKNHQRSGVQEWASIVPGAFLCNLDSRKTVLSVMWWARAIEHFPVPVLQWELERHLAFWEKS